MDNNEQDDLTVLNLLVKLKENVGGNGNGFKSDVISVNPEVISTFSKQVRLFSNEFYDKYDLENKMDEVVVIAKYVKHGKGTPSVKLSDGSNSDEDDIIPIKQSMPLDNIKEKRLISLPYFSFKSKDEFESKLKNEGIINTEWFPNENSPIPVIMKDETDGVVYLYRGISISKDTDVQTTFTLEKDIEPFPAKLDLSLFENNSYHSSRVAFLSKIFINKVLKESDLLHNFKKVTTNNGLFYNDDDLYNFHTSMRSDGMVVLAGLSGTGKSQLIQCYGESLGIDEEHMKFIPVESNWTDDSDLLGFYNVQNNSYYPGKSGLVETLAKASKNPNELFIIVFDEMNLSKVEQYFSQFLSILEMKNRPRVITLYNSTNEEDEQMKKNGYPSRIEIGDNVLFVGTVNTDESTYKFSDKVLDRSNVIRLNMQNFTKMLDSEAYHNVNLETVSLKDYHSTGLQRQKLLTKNELKLLWKLHLDINLVDPNVGIGWRIVNQINDFMNNLAAPINEFNGLDYQINQRVMTKVRGSQQQLNNLLEFKIFEDSDDGHSLYQELKWFLDAEGSKDTVEEIFKTTMSTIEKKRKDLKIYGYTI